MKLRHLSFLLFLFFTGIACTDTPPDMSRRGFKEEQLKELNTSDRFDYNRTIEPYSNPILKLLGEFLSLMGWLFNSFIGYVFLALIIAFLVYILIKHSPAIFPNHIDDDTDVVVEFTEDHIEAIDYDKLIKHALMQNDYRLAIRYTFLKVLKILQQAELIEWHKEKTNHQYLLELPEWHRSDFRKIVSYFEYTWYGQFESTEAFYQKVLEKTSTFKNQIKKSE